MGATSQAYRCHVAIIGGATAGAEAADKLAAEGLMSAEELRDLRLDWHDASGRPGAFIYTPVLLQVVARKP